ncbi:MAG: glycosyltransferase 87 family protein [Lachnospiraceae bacterium]|nr:glycosyltransferase 87 family protein [Lachnospiraceae bacterium]
MTRWEKKALQVIEKHKFAFAIAIVTILSFAIRICLLDFISGDMGEFLLPWYQEIKDAGGLLGLNRRVGNYNIIYQFVIALLTYLPIDPVWGYKLFSVIFDYLLAVLVAFIVYDLCKNKEGDRKALFAYTMVLFSPLVIMNSSLWGQCDSIYTFFCIYAVWAYIKEKRTVSFVLLGVAFAFKLQTLFILPLFVFLYIYKKNISIFHFLIMPVILIISSIPGLVMGRGIKECFRIYISQTYYYKVMWNNYPSAWCILAVGNTDAFYNLMKLPAIILALVVLGLLIYYWWSNQVVISKKTIIYMAFLVCYTCILFLPAMHERYGFIYEILGIVITFLIPQTIVLLVGLQLIILPLYSQFLFGPLIHLPLLGVVNIMIYILYLFVLNKKICEETTG